MPLKFLAVTAAIVAFVCIEAEWSRGAIEAVNSKVSCDRVASTLGSNANSGTVTKPYSTVDKLMSSLRPGQTGCLRAGVYDRDVEVAEGGTPRAPITITSFPGERATVLGRFHVTQGADHVVVQQLYLDGYNDAGLPSPTVNGDGVVFRDNDISNRNTTICFLLGSDEWGRAQGTLIERNRIHNCGELPPTNHHHGIYVEASDDARILNNWIYDNADRGVQLFPDARGTYVARNVIDGNGQGVVFSRESSDNLVEFNVISNPVVRYNLESWELTGGGNVARHNCLWSTRHWGNAGIQLDIGFPVVESLVTEPGFVGRDAKDFRLSAASPCAGFAASPVGAPPVPAKPRRNYRRPVRLRASASAVWPGGRVRLRAKITSDSARAAASKRAVLKMRRGGRWLPVGLMRLRDGSYGTSVQLAKGRRASRRFGQTPIADAPRTLRLRAFVRGAGYSNIVPVRVGR